MKILITIIICGIFIWAFVMWFTATMAVGYYKTRYERALYLFKKANTVKRHHRRIAAQLYQLNYNLIQFIGDTEIDPSKEEDEPSPPMLPDVQTLG